MELPASEPIALRLGLRVARGLGLLEGWLSVLFSASITMIGALGLTSLFRWKELTLLECAGSLLWTIGWVYLDLPYLFRILLIAIRKRHPFALTAAVERRMFPVLLRPFIVLWWIIHFAFGASGALAMHAIAQKDPQPWMMAIFGCGLGLAANGFLMLAICAATTSASVRMSVWRYRILIDIAFALLGSMVIAHRA